ncbi:MAG: NAD-dependent epimerase/dehydratase family protein [Paracoccaceae bacterium]|nr:NAD-dependent epimerase/dehydratase family protein [Paracoccaceae bacterium]
MRVLMIGGTALTGPYLIRELLGRGDEVFVLSRTGRPLFCETPLRGDRRDPEALGAALAAARPDAVVDMVPFTAADAEGLLDALARHGRAPPVVACSSLDVYAAYGRIHGTEPGPAQACPIPETGRLRTRLGPEGAAYDKLSVERLLAGGLPDVTLLRLPAIYGWPDASRLAPYLDVMLDGAREITLSPARARFRFSRALHKNAAHGLALAAGRRGRRVYNLAEPNAFNEAEWVARIAACCGWRGRVRADGPGEGPVQDLTACSALIRDELGYSELHEPGAGLAEAVAFHAWQRRGIAYVKGY